MKKAIERKAVRTEGPVEKMKPEDIFLEEVKTASAVKYTVFKIKTAAEMEYALKELQALKMNYANQEAKLKSITSPIKRSVRLLEDNFKTIVAPLVKTIDEIKAVVAEYRAEEARRVAKEQAKIAAKLEVAAEAGNEKKVNDLIMKSEATQQASTVAATTFSKRWTFAEKDINAVPRDYLMLDEVKVNAAIRAGVRDIPGLEIFQKEVISTRTI